MQKNNSELIKVNEDTFYIHPLSFVDMNEYKCEIKIFKDENNFYSFLRGKDCVPLDKDDILNIKAIFIKDPLIIACTQSKLNIDVLTHECVHLSLYLMRKMNLLSYIPTEEDCVIGPEEETLCYIVSNSLNQIAEHIKKSVELTQSLN